MTPTSAPPVAAVVLDIEGTTSPTAAVKLLYGYVLDRLGLWLAQRGPEQQDVIDAVRRSTGEDTLDAAGTAAVLREWLAADRKDAVLKHVQGLICHEGFRAGQLHGRFFPDVAPALRRWAATGARVFVYSSGSAGNQRDWFAHAEPPVDVEVVEHFDLDSAGRKDDPASYRRIGAAIGAAPAAILFVSDRTVELDAAAAAGWQVAGVVRPGEPGPGAPGPHLRWYDSLPMPMPMPMPPLPTVAVPAQTPGARR